MRRWWAIGLGCFALSACVKQSPATAGADGAEWKPTYTAAQLALLVPTSEKVRVPAKPTYPDMSTFRYGRDLELSDPREAVAATKIVADIIAQSDRTYMVTEIPAELENAAAQYGPPGEGEPDGFSVATRMPSGGLKLIRLDDTDSARQVAKNALIDLKAGRGLEAARDIREELAKRPEIPALHVVLGQALLSAKQNAEAEAAFREALRLDSTLASAHTGLAAALFLGGNVMDARRSIAHALAYHPRHAPAIALATRLAADKPSRIEPYPIFLEVDSAGAVRVGSEPTASARMYAGCRAVMRFEPELRSILFGSEPQTPYFLSVPEEIFCLESAIGAYVVNHTLAREHGREEPKDAKSGALLALAHTEGLLGFVMFEILGRHRPERARLAPGYVHRAMVAYVQRHILGYDPGPDLTPYTAMTDGTRSGDAD